MTKRIPPTAVSHPNRLKVLRAERGVTQTLVSMVAKLSTTRYCLIENGDVDPSDDERQRIAAAFSLAPGDIFPAVTDAAPVSAEEASA